jgi:2-methylcitrate dehydratase PrpD
VERVTAFIHPSAYDICSFDAPRDVMQAKYSVPYIVGAISVFGALGLAAFAESALGHPETRRIMPLVTGGVLEGAEWTSDVRYETEPPTRLSLKLKGRPVLEKLVDRVRGYPVGGLFTRDEAAAKFLDCTASVLGDRAQSVLQRLLDIEQVGDVRSLVRDLAVG